MVTFSRAVRSEAKVLVRKGIKRFPDWTRAIEGRREAWLFPPSLDARVRQTSFLGSCVDEDEEEDVGGVGKLADCSASKVGGGGSREPSATGEVGAVGRTQVKGRSIVDMKWFLEQEKSKR